MLKLGGTLSKAHSVCVPNKITMLRQFPLRPEDTGLIYYSKPGRGGARAVKHAVRPAVVFALWRALKAGCPPYSSRPLEWVDQTACELFEGHNPNQGAVPPSVEVELRFPQIEMGEEPLEDVGPAAGQHPGAQDASDETTSGFISLVPAADVQGSIEQALAAARSRQSSAAAGGSRAPASTAPVFHVSGGSHAVSEFDEHFFASAFPEIFLDGQGDFSMARPIAIEKDEWLDHLMWTGDQRAARHRVFCFVGFSNLQREKAMKQGSFFVGTRLSTSNGQADELQRDAPISLEDLNERVMNGDDSLARSIYFWGGNLRGSHAYNAGLKREIDAMLTAELQREEPRPPSLFLSMSCAEFYWRSMLEYLRKHIAAVEGIDPGDLLSDENKSVRFNKLQEYAHVVTLYFEQRATRAVVTSKI